MPYKEIPQFTFESEFKEPVKTYLADSHVKIKDVWATHPSLEDRIASARTTTIALTSKTKPVSAWTLIPRDISEKVSNLYTSLIRKNTKDELTYISDEHFEEWLKKNIKENFIDERLRPFFGYTIINFDLEHPTEAPKESPFNDENATTIAELYTRCEEWQQLVQVRNKKIKAKEVQINGVVYKRKDIPFEKLEIEIDLLLEKVVKIFSDIYSYIYNKCDEDKKSSYKGSFTALFYAQHIKQDLLNPLFAHRDNLLNALNIGKRMDKDPLLCSRVVDYEQHLKTVISELDLDWIATSMSLEDYTKSLKEYLNSNHNTHDEINRDAIEEMICITTGLSELQEMILNTAKRGIFEITASKL